ncbi:Retinol dehydrogenase 12 [Coccomyxa sp. Obi]|nr:Retinol dehydrogenase 12 [Coccomyxa sp. Obi]
MSKTHSNGSNGSVDPRSKHFWTTKDMPPQDGKVVIVTGASSGMGWYCAQALAEHGAHVIIAARSLDRRLESEERLKPCTWTCHLSGVFLVPHDHTEEGFETTVGINYFGHFLLTHLLMDKLKESAPGSRVVSMASLFELLGNVNWSDLEGKKARESGIFEYSTSKVEIIMMIREMNKRLKDSGVECFASQPGLVQTQLNMRKLDHSKLTSNLLDISTRIYGQRADRASLCLQRPASDPTVTGYGGSYFSPPWLWILALNFDHAGMREPGNSLARDEAAWARLYNQTLLIVNHKLQEKGLGSIEPITA